MLDKIIAKAVEFSLIDSQIKLHMLNTDRGYLLSITNLKERLAR
jgi:hypothetical protein